MCGNGHARDGADDGIVFESVLLHFLLAFIVVVILYAGKRPAVAARRNLTLIGQHPGSKALESFSGPDAGNSPIAKDVALIGRIQVEKAARFDVPVVLNHRQ